MFLTIGAGAAAMFLQGPYGGPPGGGFAPGGAPRGPYMQNCSTSYVDQGRLFALCRDKQGRPRGSSIELRRCGGQLIDTNDGRLQCGSVRGDDEDANRIGNYRPGPGYGGPGNGGPGRPGGQGPGYGRGPSITIFEDSEYRGRSQTFTGEVPDLSRTPYNDMITSFRVQGRWQVCSDAFYQGRCAIYDYNESNVSTNRLNDQISSMRPIR